MSQRNNFSGGFLLGSIVGGVVGGILGAVLTKQLGEASGAEDRLNPDSAEPKLKERKPRSDRCPAPTAPAISKSRGAVWKTKLLS